MRTLMHLIPCSPNRSNRSAIYSISNEFRSYPVRVNIEIPSENAQKGKYLDMHHRAFRLVIIDCKMKPEY